MQKERINKSKIKIIAIKFITNIINLSNRFFLLNMAKSLNFNLININKYKNLTMFFLTMHHQNHEIGRTSEKRDVPINQEEITLIEICNTTKIASSVKTLFLYFQKSQGKLKESVLVLKFLPVHLTC